MATRGSLQEIRVEDPALTMLMFQKYQCGETELVQYLNVKWLLFHIKLYLILVQDLILCGNWI